MMQEVKLPKIVSGRAKRVGRGYGSGKGGHTSGRGQKGQKARRKIPILFEGYKTKKSQIRRLPQLRGKSKFASKHPPVVVRLSDLNKLPTGSVVDVETLIKHSLVGDEAKKYGVKVLSSGKLTKKLKIVVPMSKSAAKHLTKEVLKKKA